MVKITILDNKKCHIDLPDEIILQRLRNVLSYRMEGVEYTAAYQNGWNGITYLLTKTNKFSLGLLNKVKQFLDNNYIEYTIIDQRKPKEQTNSIDLTKKLEKLGMIPREHQVRIANLIDTHDRGIVRAATGAGKTLATALMVAKLNRPTIIYVIGLDLLDQFYNLYSKLFDEEIGYIGNGIYKPARITIASIWSVGRALNLKKIVDDEEDIDQSEKDLSEDKQKQVVNLLKEGKLHIFDESHVITTDTISEIYKNINPEYIFGFSGTPFKDDSFTLLVNSILGEQIINVSASELIEKELLAQPIIKFVAVPKMTVGQQYQSVYKDYIVENDIRNNLIVKNLEELLEKKYTPLILFKQIKHGNILLEKIEEKNIKCAMLYGNDTLVRRNEIKEQLVNKEISCILASTIFDIGIDIPELSALILCGSGKSRIRACQRVGRVVRKFPGKKFAAVVDFFDQAKFVKKHSQIRAEIYASEPGFKVIKCKEMKKK